MARHAALLLTVVLFLGACQAGEGDDDRTDRSEVAADSAAASTRQAPATVTDGVTVSGHGRVSGEPDTLRATVGVHVVRADVDQAFDDAASAAGRVLDVVRDSGVDEADIQTRELSIRPEHEHREGEPPRVVGYAVRNLVEVAIRDVDAAGELLAAVAEAAGDDARVEALRFSLEDNEALLRTAREAAFDDARTKAEHYASLAGAELGELAGMTESGAHRPEPVAFAQEEAATDGGAPIMRGEQEVGVQVQATWALR